MFILWTHTHRGGNIVTNNYQEFLIMFFFQFPFSCLFSRCFFIELYTSLGGNSKKWMYEWKKIIISITKHKIREKRIFFNFYREYFGCSSDNWLKLNWKVGIIVVFFFNGLTMLSPCGAFCVDTGEKNTLE